MTARKPEINFVSEARSFCEQLENFNLIPSFPEHKVHIYYVKEHRCVIKITGPQLSDEITGTDPTKDNCPLLRCQPTDDSKDARMTCAIVNELHDNVLKILSAHPINARRSLEAKPPVNVVLLRGCSVAIDVPSFESKHGLRTFLIAPTSIIAGIGRTLQMDLLKAAGATGTISTDMLSKAKVAMNTLFDPTNAYDMAIIHIKCTDDCGHSKDLYGKIDALERVDQMLGWILTYSPVKDGPHLVIITGDHSTPVLLGDHSTEPVPFVIARTDGSKLPGASSQCNFDEISCAQGVLGRFLGGSVMKIIRTVQDLPQIT